MLEVAAEGRLLRLLTAGPVPFLQRPLHPNLESSSHPGDKSITRHTKYMVSQMRGGILSGRVGSHAV